MRSMLVSSDYSVILRLHEFSIRYFQSASVNMLLFSSFSRTVIKGYPRIQYCDYMSRQSGLGFGGFLLGLGAAWIVFTTYEVSGNFFSWLMILGGASIVASSLLSRNRAMRQANQLIGGIIGGFVVALVFSYAFGYVGFLPGIGGLTGSGTPVTETKSITGFTSVSAAMGFNVEITESSSYSVRVTVDDNVVDKLRVTKIGDTLSIALDPGTYTRMTLRAVVTMPDIEGLELSGGSHVDAEGSAGDLTVDASGGSTLDLENFPVHDASIGFSGGSSGTISLDGNLDADVSGGSRLWYIGSPTLGNIDTSGGATVQKK